MGNEKKLNLNNLRPMLVKEILSEHTDEDHFITVNDIIDILSSDYGINTTRKTVYEDIDMLLESGFDIECVKGLKNTNMYHILTRAFDLVELRVLIDAVESLRFLPLSKSKSLVKKLTRLAGPSSDYLINSGNAALHPRTENNQIYYIIDTINKAMLDHKQIAFRYYEYLTSSKKALKNDGKAYTVSPYRLTCCNDFYYLIGFSEKHMKVTAFRVDRICSTPTITEISCVPEPNDLYVESYIRESFHMMSGETEEIFLEFDSSVIDAMADRFGHEMDITSISKTTCRALVNAQPNNVFFSWIFGFEGKVRIKAPTSIQNQYIKMVSKEMARL